MGRRNARTVVTQNLRDAIRATGNTTESVAAAVDMTPLELESRLSGACDFELTEVARVGGFLRLTPEDLLKEAS